MTFGDMITRCLDRIGWESDNELLVRRVKAELNAEYDTVRAKRNWSWLHARATADITDSTTYVTLPTDCRSVRQVSLESTGAVLNFKPEVLENLQDGAVSYQSRGEPTDWCVVANADNSGQALLVMPLPWGSDTLEILYTRAGSQLSLNSDEPLFPADFHGILVEGAISRLAAQDSYDNGIAQRAWAARQDLMRALMHTSEPNAPAHQAMAWLGHGQTVTLP